METILNVKHISKRFGQQLALDDVSLTVKQGEIYGLIGKNGAGKTTLIKVITQLIQPNLNGYMHLSESALSLNLQRLMPT